MKTLFNNYWVTLGLMLLVSVADLIGLPTKIQFGVGFVLTMGYIVWGGIWKIKNLQK